MDNKQQTIERIIDQVLNQAAKSVNRSVLDDEALIPVGVSNRHVHLSRSDMDTLFGPGSELERKKAMKQPGQYAAEETITLKGPKGELKRVRVLGPLRHASQIEISVSDGFTLGIVAPLRQSGDLEGTPGVEMIGPHGSVKKDQGLIVAQRHIHMTPETAAKYGFQDGEEVDIKTPGQRAVIMRKVLVRVTTASADEVHVDIEEANAAFLKNDDLVQVTKVS